MENNSSNYYSFLKIIILIIIFFYFIFSFKINRHIKNEINYKDSLINNYSIYNEFKYPQISILITRLKLFDEILTLINNLRNQTLKDIQIIFVLSKLKSVDIIKNYSLNDNRIEIYQKKKNEKNLYLINKIKGKYTIIMNKFILIKENELEKYYNFSKGKTCNYFKFSIENKYFFYLIRTKILKDIYDNRKKFNSYNKLIDHIISIPEPKLNYVFVSLCLNNHYLPLAYVSMISILSTKQYYTYIAFYLVIPQDFNLNNIKILETLYEQYDFFNITFLKMDNRYKNAFTSRYITEHAYYRFSLGELIPFLNKIIYLDSDTIALKDLTNFYNLNFNDKIILGQITQKNRSPKNGKYNINSGVLLLNLKEMRNINLEKKVLHIINNGYKSNFHDQFLLNKYFYKYISIFPPEYHARPLKNYEEITKYNENSGRLYDNDYFYFSWKYPTIRHYLGRSKPKKFDISNVEDWWYFARKSKYFNKKTHILRNIFNFTY